MGFELEAQDEIEFRQIRARELQLDNTDKLNQVSDALSDVDLSSIESQTKEIKSLVITNLEEQTNLDDIFANINKIAQGISDIKRSQTNLNKKLNELQNQIEGE